jgi:hypothetical protein
VVSEKTIKMWKVNRQVMAKAHIAFGKVSSKEGFACCSVPFKSAYMNKL